MRSQGRKFGLDYIMIPVIATVASGAGKRTTIVLENIPAEIDGMPVCVRGLAVKYPQVDFALTGSTQMDGCCAYELAGDSTFKWAANSPPHKGKGTRTAWSTLDGHTLGNVLAFETGAPFFLGGGRDVIANGEDVAAADATDTDKETLTRRNLRGRRRAGNWAQFLGSFAAADATSTAAVSMRPWFYYAIGERAREMRGRFAVPSGWVSGKRGASCSGQDAGSLEITLPATMADLALTWTTTGDSGKFEVFVIAKLVDPSKLPAPLPFNIDELEPGNNSAWINAPSGIITLLAAMKKLAANGDMQAHGYTNLELHQHGTPVAHAIVAENIVAQALALNEDEGFTISHVDTGRLSAAPAARRLNNMVPLFLHRGSLLSALGSDAEGAVKVKIVSTTETSHRFVCGYRSLMNDSFRQAAESWAQGLGSSCSGEAKVARMEPAAANGNAIGSEAMKSLLPGTTRILDAKAVAAAGDKGPG